MLPHTIQLLSAFSNCQLELYILNFFYKGSTFLSLSCHISKRNIREIIREELGSVCYDTFLRQTASLVLVLNEKLDTYLTRNCLKSMVFMIKAEK